MAANEMLGLKELTDTEQEEIVKMWLKDMETSKS
jgi:hypothetical protein